MIKYKKKIQTTYHKKITTANLLISKNKFNFYIKKNKKLRSNWRHAQTSYFFTNLQTPKQKSCKHVEDEVSNID